MWTKDRLRSDTYHILRFFNKIYRFFIDLQDIYIVGGHIRKHKTEKGNIINTPSNEYAELNMFLDPLAAKTVFDSRYNITLIPLSTQRRVSRFNEVIGSLHLKKKTPESIFARHLLSRLHWLKRAHPRYQHVV